MIKRALATLLCLLGAAAIALGIASATAWRADDVLVARAQAAPGTTMVVTEPGVLDMAADTVTVTADADSRVVIALGRTDDVDAWVDGDAHTRVTGLAEWHVLATSDVEAEPEPTPTEPPTETPAAPETPAATETPTAPAEGGTEGETEGGTGDAGAGGEDGEATEPVAPDPSGSDLWVAQVSADDRVEFEWTAREGRWSVLVAAVGEDAGPPTVSLAWPQVVTTPWLWPGVVVGSLLLLGGLVWWTLLLLAGRRAGRRAVVPPSAVTAPEPVGAAAPAVPAGPLTRRQLREMEEQQRGRGGRAGRSLAERFPVVVPGPARDTEATAEPLGAPATPAAEAPAPATGTPAPATPEQPSGRRARRDTGRVEADLAATTVLPRVTDEPAPRTAPAAGGVPAATPPSGARERRFGLRSRRRPDETGAGSAPTVPTPEPPSADEPAVPAATQWTPAASADAWRRAWGLPAAGGQPGQGTETARQGEAAPPDAVVPTPPDQPGEPPLRRRRDNR